MSEIYINKSELLEAIEKMPIIPEMTGLAIKHCIKFMITENHFRVTEIEREEAKPRELRGGEDEPPKEGE